MTPWRKKKPILRSHPYQSLVLRARMKAQWQGATMARSPWRGHFARGGSITIMITITSMSMSVGKSDGVSGLHNSIERSGSGVTIQRGGPHG
jgi:hypothetical protein